MFSERINRLKKINGKQLTTDIINRTSETIVNMNRDQLKLKGVTRDDILISSFQPYAFSTISLKFESGSLTGNNPNIVNLYETGAFAEGFFVRPQGDSVFISSRDGKTSELTEKYGDEIFGLTDENLATYNRGVFLPEYLQAVRKLI